jgi:hypothetical protein
MTGLWLRGRVDSVAGPRPWFRGFETPLRGSSTTGSAYRLPVVEARTDAGR